MKGYSSFLIASAVVAAVASMSTHAEERAWSIKGFGTVGGVMTDSGDGKFRSSGRQPNGATDDNVDFGVDSKLGLQLTGKLTNKFSVTAQLLSTKNEDKNYNPRMDWLFAKYEATNNFAIRVGRMGLPVFLVSDYRNVGYANPWIRTPVEVYNQVPVFNFDGIDALIRANVGDTSINFQPLYGQREFYLPAGGGAKAKGEFHNLWGLNVSGEYGPLTLRAGFVKTKLDFTTDATTSLFNGLRSPALGPLSTSARQVATDLEAVGKDASFYGLGMIFDNGNWLAQAEYTQRRTESYVSDSTGWYATVGHRFGKWMPYVTRSEVKTDSPTSDSTIPRLGPQLTALNSGVNSLLRGSGQQSWSVGVRYDVAKNIALKAQWDNIALVGQGSTGTFAETSPGFSGTVNVFGLAADFVF